MIARSGGPALNTRRDSASDVIRDVEFAYNFVDNSPSAFARRPPEKCMSIRGTDGTLLRYNACAHTASVYVSGGAAYYGEGDVEANRDVTIEGLTLTDLEGDRGIVIGARVDGFVLRRVTVTRTPAAMACISWQTPLRGLQLEDVKAVDCGGAGLLQSGPGSGANTAEGVRLARIVVDGVDAVATDDAVYFNGIELQGAGDRAVVSDALSETSCSGGGSEARSLAPGSHRSPLLAERDPDRRSDLAAHELEPRRGPRGRPS